MNLVLEEKLIEYEKNTPISNDTELTLALIRIIEDEEARGLSEENIDLITEATDLLLSLEKVDTEKLDQRSEEIAYKAMTEVIANTGKRKSNVSQKKISLIRGWSAAARRVAVFSIAVLSAVCLITFNGEVRAALKETFVTWMKELAIIDLSDALTSETEETHSVHNADSIDELKISYIPDGYAKKAEEIDSDSMFYHYEGNDGKFIIIEFLTTDPSGVIHGTDSHEYSETEINGSIGYIFYDNEENTGSVIFGNSNVTVIIGGTAEKDILLKVAKGIQEKN